MPRIHAIAAPRVNLRLVAQVVIFDLRVVRGDDAWEKDARAVVDAATKHSRKPLHKLVRRPPASVAGDGGPHLSPKSAGHFDKQLGFPQSRAPRRNRVPAAASTPRAGRIEAIVHVADPQVLRRADSETHLRGPGM